MKQIKEKLKKFINNNPFLATSYDQSIELKYQLYPTELTKIEDLIVDIFKYAFYSSKSIGIVKTDIERSTILTMHDEKYAFTMRICPFTICSFPIKTSKRENKNTTMLKLKMKSDNLTTLFTNIMNKLPEEIKAWYLLENFDFVSHIKYKQNYIDINL